MATRLCRSYCSVDRIQTSSWRPSSALILPHGRALSKTYHAGSTPQLSRTALRSIALDKNGKLLTLAGTTCLEFLLTGGLLWSPLACALLLILLTPSKSEEEAEKRAEIDRAVEKVRRQMETQVAVTPPESAAWMWHMMSQLWGPYVAPMVLKDNLRAWQAKVASTAPSGWTMELVDMSLGVEAPTMTNYRVYNDVSSNRMASMEYDMEMISSSMRVAVRGSGPLGQFTATVSDFSVKGSMRMIPIGSERMALISYREPPEANFKLQISGIPLVGPQDVPTLSFLRTSFTESLKDTLVEPRRAAISFDYDYTGQQAIDTSVNLYVESIQGLQPSLLLYQQPTATKSASATASKAATAGRVTLAKPSQDQGVSTITTQSSSSKSTEAVIEAASGAVANSGSSSVRRSTVETTVRGQHGSDPGSGSGSGSQPSSRDGLVADAPGTKSVEGMDNASLSTSQNSSDSSSKPLPSATPTISSRRDKFSLRLQEATGLHYLSSGAASSKKQGSGVAVMATNLNTKLQRSTQPHHLSADKFVTIPVQESIKMSLGQKDGIIKLEVQDLSRRGHVLGFAMIHVAATKDGHTLFWALGKGGEPLALRWQPGLGPWRVTVPLEGCPSCPRASITLQLSTDLWVCSQPYLDPVSIFKTPGHRTIVLQVFEARNLAAKDWAGTSDPYVLLHYDGRSYRTHTVYNATSAVWNRTFILPENPALLNKRIRLAVWDSGVSRDEILGSASVSLDMVSENSIQDRWFQLIGEESGEIRVRLAMVPGLPDSSAVQQMVTVLTQTLPTAASPSLQVVVLAARHLPSRPSALGTRALRDSYCHITFAGARQVTPIVRQSQNPAWNHSAIFPLDLNGAQRHQQLKQVVVSTVSATAPAPVTSSSVAAEAYDTLDGNTSKKMGFPSAVTASSITGGTSSVHHLAQGQSRDISPQHSSKEPPSLKVPPQPPSVAPATAGMVPGIPVPQKPTHVLRIEVMDMDLLPPDDDLGYALLDVGALVPEPWMVWESWVPLEKGSGAEVLVRVCHLDASPRISTAIPMPAGWVLSSQDPAENLSPMDKFSASSTAARAGSASSTAPTSSGSTSSSTGTGTSPRLEQVLLSNFTEQVRSANDRALGAMRYSEQMRERLSQEWIPKVQDWWGTVTQRVSGFSGNQGLLDSLSGFGRKKESIGIEAQLESNKRKQKRQTQSSSLEGADVAAVSTAYTPPTAPTATDFTEERLPQVNSELSGGSYVRKAGN
ncbi:hypothetical protein CEUSTIGMA_g11650.t1 [Chlamydomonas eustigma]|uniref:C2 domain-containing protein n=1 Tax=Chlamydomonas eustigma TaxID=1157962 RepID=A0A250XMC5_9CHLO|nr:hypothetical protein CEUSTIGMA_g11650.t1 [Chlamydomonas eustigma]|eukprot:GAX84227.1 hypothetical protein CEUSTIGMA_g11650.t1 [Chlamydomonas eustigma]